MKRVGKAKAKSSNYGTAAVIGMGAVTGIATEVAIIALLALFTFHSIIEEGNEAIFAMIGALLAAFTGSVLSLRRAEKLLLLSAAAIGAVMELVHLLLWMLINGEVYFSAAITAAVFGGAVIGGLVSAMKSGSKHSKKAVVR